MAEIDWIFLLRANLALRAVGSSAMRKAPSGTVRAAQKYLATVPFDWSPGEGGFVAWLDLRTQELVSRMPVGKWGRARKALNLYLRDCYYNYELRDEQGLDKVSVFLELPLDSKTAQGLSAFSAEAPKWNGVHALTEAQSIHWQALAGTLAAKYDRPRVDLDVLLWSTSLA